MPGGRRPRSPYPAQPFTPAVPALTPADPALDPSETVVSSDTGTGADGGTPGRLWHEAAPVPDPVDDGRSGRGRADAGVEIPGNDDADGSDGSEGAVGADGSDGAAGNEGAPPDGVTEPDAEAVAPPPDPLADSAPPEVPTAPSSVEPVPVAPGSDPPPGSPVDPVPGGAGAPGTGIDGNAVSGNDGRLVEGRNGALAGVTAVLAPRPPSSAPPTAEVTAPSATANSRR